MNAQLTEPIVRWNPKEAIDEVAEQTDTRRHLAPVPRPHRKPQRSPLFLALVCVGMFLVILAVQLWLSISISRGAYESNALIVENRELGRNERALQQEVDMLASPQHLAERAIELGMVQNAHPAYLKLESGTVVGSLAASTTDARDNLIPNAALTSLTEEPAKTPPVMEEKETQHGEATTAVNTEPLPWNGNLPAPDTH